MAKNIEKILQDCFHPKEGRPNLHKMSINAQRAEQHIDKAHKNLRTSHPCYCVSGEDAHGRKK